MAITLYTMKPDSSKWDVENIDFDGLAYEWILKNVDSNNFLVYEGDICEQNEISRTDKMRHARDVSIVITPASGVKKLVRKVFKFIVNLLSPPVDDPYIPTQPGSPNNQLSDRNNKARVNQRIVDLCGKVKSIPDVVQKEWAIYRDNTEYRTGLYCVGRKQLQIEDIKDADTLFSDSNQSAGIYYPFKSPNNSTPDIQIGDPINERVVGVFESTDAIDQLIPATNEVAVDTFGTNERLYPDGTLTANIDFYESFKVGESAKLVEMVVSGVDIGAGAMDIVDVSNGSIKFDTSGDPSWGGLPSGGATLDSGYSPRVEKTSPTIIGPFKISSIKVDRLIFNAYAPSGMHRENENGRQGLTVDYVVYYQKLDDNLDPVGPLTQVDGSISGRDAQTKGDTVDIDLGGLTFVEWSVERITPKNYSFEGNITDDIKIRSVFGLYKIEKDHFGDVTIIQTQRKSLAQTTLIKSPELNCIATEMVNRYVNGVFEPTLTPNTQGMQSLIRLALDPYVGRREQTELDLDLLVQTQSDIEAYFNNEEAGQFSYSFDNLNTTAQEHFTTIANAIFCNVWREGRVLKSWFERPQSLPEMVFTHRSKRPNSERWTRTMPAGKRKDSIEITYTNDKLYTKETLYYPEDRSGVNPLKVDIAGIKGVSQATWRMMREYNKLVYQSEAVDFTATAEGRFVLPSRLISVVKGSRVGSYDGYIRSVNGLTLELSQDVTFTANDDHFIILKRRNGETESIPCFSTGQKRIVTIAYAPQEPIYTGNSELKTEFSFGNEARLKGQLMLPQEINPSEKQYVQIKAINYSDEYYKDDPIQPVGRAFSDGFSNGLS